MSVAQTMTASEFKAKCLDVFDRLVDRELERVVITKRGRVVAIVTPPEQEAVATRGIHGFMRGSVVMPAAFDLTAPVIEERFTVEAGELHG